MALRSTSDEGVGPGEMESLDQVREELQTARLGRQEEKMRVWSMLWRWMRVAGPDHRDGRGPGYDFVARSIDACADKQNKENKHVVAFFVHLAAEEAATLSARTFHARHPTTLLTV